MDPLSVTASILGILSAAAISVLRDTAKNAVTVHSEIKSSLIILSALQTFLDDLDAAPQNRKRLIPVDQLVITFTDGVLLFSELEALVLTLQSPSETLRARIRWARIDKILASLLFRLQCFKSAIGIMLTIFQCNSDIEATRSQQDLYSVVSDVLNSSRELSRRLENIEGHIDISSILPRQQSDMGTGFSSYGDNPSLSAAGDLAQARASNLLETRHFEFENDLEASRPYRKAKRDTVDFSFRSSIVLSHAWSTLSEVTLSDISAISVVALPIISSLGDISNGHHYTFREPSSRQSQRDLPAYSKKPLDETLPQDGPISPVESISFPLSLPREMVANPQRIRPDNKLPPEVTRFPYKICAGGFLSTCHLVILGASGVDTSQIARRFNPPIDEYDLTLGNLYHVQRVIEDQVFLLGILDVTLQQEYPAMHQADIRNGEGFMLVYSITSRKSFEEVTCFRKHILWVKHLDDFPAIVVGNHCEKENEREISAKEGQALAQSFECPFIEVSSDTGKNIKDAFYELVREIKWYDKRQSPWRYRIPL